MSFTRFGLPVRGWIVLVFSYWLACFSEREFPEGWSTTTSVFKGIATFTAMDMV